MTSLRYERAFFLTQFEIPLDICQVSRCGREELRFFFTCRSHSPNCAPNIQLVAPRYEFARAYGIDFGTADRIANNYSIPLDDDRRLRAALLDGLSEASSNGHCGLQVDEAKRAMEHRIGARQGGRAFARAVNDNHFEVVDVAGHKCLFERSVFNMEKEIAKRCAEIAKGMWFEMFDMLQSTFL